METQGGWAGLWGGAEQYKKITIFFREFQAADFFTQSNERSVIFGHRFIKFPFQSGYRSEFRPVISISNSEIFDIIFEYINNYSKSIRNQKL